MICLLFCIFLSLILFYIGPFFLLFCTSFFFSLLQNTFKMLRNSSSQNTLTFKLNYKWLVDYIYHEKIEGESVKFKVKCSDFITGADPGGGGAPPAPPLKSEKNMIVLRKIVIFHTKYPNNFRIIRLKIIGEGYVTILFVVYLKKKRFWYSRKTG